MNARAQIIMFTNLALLFVGKALCVEHLTIQGWSLTRSPVSGELIPSLTPADNRSISELLLNIQENNGVLERINAEIAEIKTDLRNFNLADHSGEPASRVLDNAKFHKTRIETRENLIARITRENAHAAKRIEQIRTGSRIEVAEAIVTDDGVTFVPRARVTPPVAQTTVKRTKAPATVVEEQTTTTVTRGDSAIPVDGVKIPADVVVEQLVVKQGWSLTTKIIIGVLVAAVMLALVIIVLYLQKS